MMFACIINQLINNDIKIYANLSMHTNSILIIRYYKSCDNVGERSMMNINGCFIRIFL